MSGDREFPDQLIDELNALDVALCPQCDWPIAEHADGEVCQSAPAAPAAAQHPAGPQPGERWMFRHAGHGRVDVLARVTDRAGRPHVVYEYLSGDAGVSVLPVDRFTGSYVLVTE